ncbi:MAG: hypothetical protein IJS80_06605 [Lachnospiraceae bacterium]|nr:hypothetical protein [Lachnospiraceae bacterium]
MKRRKMNLLAKIAAVLTVMSLVFVEPAYAKDYNARLKECLQTDPLYTATTVVRLNNAFNSDKRQFKSDYNNKYVVVSGNVKIDFVTAGNKTVISDIGGNKCSVDVSAAQAQQDMTRLKTGDYVTVYARVTVSGVLELSYELTAVTVMSGNTWFTAGNRYFYPSEDFDWTEVSDLTSGKKVRYRIPWKWNNGYVKSDLTNNDVKGYQYCLNAIAPQDYEYPEVFYIFYFNNETYLEKVPTNPTKSDYKKIEKEIIKNILEAVGEDSGIAVDTFTDASGTELHYYTTTYRPKDGRDYRLEFLFRPEKKGITCMLYLYFPKEEAVHHVREAAYLVETMTIEE